MLRPEVLSKNYKLPCSGALDLDIVNAHTHSINNRDDLLRSSMCGCFHCSAMFRASEIEEWTDMVDGVLVTGICPWCGIDAVVGSASGYQIEESFLKSMGDYWFRAINFYEMGEPCAPGP